MKTKNFPFGLKENGVVAVLAIGVLSVIFWSIFSLSLVNQIFLQSGQR